MVEIVVPEHEIDGTREAIIQPAQVLDHVAGFRDVTADQHDIRGRIPDELDEEEGADDVGGPAVRDAGEAPGGTGGEGDGKKDEGPEEGGGTEENGDPEETEGPPVVRKEAVRKRRPKDG